VLISESTVECSAEGSGMAFEEEVLGFGSQWKFTVKSQSSPESFACFGIYDLDTLIEMGSTGKDPSLESGASFCTNGKEFNGFGGSSSTGALASREASVEQTYTLQFYYGKLIISDASDNSIEFSLSKTKLYFPFIHMEKGGSISLTNKEITNKCPILYDECGFQGKATEIC